MAFQLSAEQTPFNRNRIYMDDVGRILCATCAEHAVQHMTRYKVSMFTISIPETCDICEKEIRPEG